MWKENWAGCAHDQAFGTTRQGDIEVLSVHGLWVKHYSDSDDRYRLMAKAMIASAPRLKEYL